jgi:hypothetical protein
MVPSAEEAEVEAAVAPLLIQKLMMTQVVAVVAALGSLWVSEALRDLV